MRQSHTCPEFSVYAIGSPDTFDIGIEDTTIAVYRNGAECGYIIARYDEWNNELTYIPSPGLPDWIVGYYTGEDYPDSAIGQGYTFQN